MPVKTTTLTATASVTLLALTLGAAAQQADPFAPPERAWQQGPIHRNTIPTDFETHIIVNNAADRARAERIIEFYDVLAGDPTIDVVGEYVSDSYIQHSTQLPNGRAPLAMLFAGSAAENPTFIDVHKVIVVGDWAMAHVNFRQMDDDDPRDLGFTAVDMYFFDSDGLITEHWDVLQDVPSHQPNPNGMFLKLFEGE